jgi:Secretion system C-terminal sorting domain/Ig-like domain CHU_C associated
MKMRNKHFIKSINLIRLNHFNNRHFAFLFILLNSILGAHNAIQAQCTPASLTFNYTGGVQNFVVPNSINRITFSVTGADGGDGGGTTGNGGSGGSINASFSVLPGDNIRLIVGQAGESTFWGGGGGGTAVINCGNPANCATGTLLIVAGGGGGGKGNNPGGGATAVTGSGAAGSNDVGGGVSFNGAQASKTSISAGGLGAGVSNGGKGFGGGGALQSIPGGGGGGGGYTGGNGTIDFGYGGSNYVNASAIAGFNNTAGIDGGSGGNNTNGVVVLSYTCPDPWNCVSVTVVVNTLSVAPLSISGISTICNGGNTTLTLVGGSAGTGATAKWYSGSCDGTPEGVGNNITVSPTANTTYYVRYEGTCNTTACASQTVVLNFPSLGGTLSPAQTAVCSGTAVQLTLAGNTGIISEWEKQVNCTGGWTSIGSGGVNTLSLTPAVTTCYRVKTTNGVCPATNSSVATITVDQPAVSGVVSLFSNVAITQASVCPNSFAQLKVSGYTGVVATWQSNTLNSPTRINIPFTANQTNLTVNGSSVISTIFYRVVIYTNLGICTGIKAVAYSNAFKVSKRANCTTTAPFKASDEGVPANPLTLIKAYPIPSNSRITLEIEGSTEGVTQIEILDLTGKVVQRSFQNVLERFNELTLDIQNLSTGLYLVKVKDSSHQEAVLKVSKM